MRARIVTGPRLGGSREGGSARPAPRRRGRRRLRAAGAALAALAVLGALALAACSGGDAADDATANDPADWSGTIEVRQGQPVVPTLVNSRLAVGPNRLAVGLFGSDGALIHDATAVELRLYTIDDAGRGTLAAEAALRASALVEEPAVGEPAPATRQPTLADGVDITELSTAQQPNPALYRLTVAEALELHRPLVVTFATPAFCQTRFCGPVLEQVVMPLQERYAGRVEFVHIEPFDLARLRGEGTFAPVPAMAEWGLSTEPWVFVVDAQGLVAAKFEGVLSQQELVEVLERLGA